MMNEEEGLSASRSACGLRWSLFLPALVVPFIFSLFYFVLYPGTGFGNAFYTAHKVFLIVWPVVAGRLILGDRLALEKGAHPRRLASLVPGILFGMVVVSAMVLLLHLPVGEALLDANREKIVQRIHDLGVAEHFLLFAVFLSVIHSAMEEFYWRWFAFGQARKLMPTGLAHFVAATGFSLHHIVILSQFFPLLWAFALGAGVGVGGAFWSWLLDRYRTLVGAWVSHMIVDFGLMWLGWRMLMGA